MGNDADTCDWPGCRDMAIYTYSVATPTIGLCDRHWEAMCFDRENAWVTLALKPKLPPDIGFAEAAAVVRNHRPE